MKKVLPFLFCLATTLVSAQLNMTLKSQLEYDERSSDIWGYNAPDGREYAIMGLLSATVIIDITDTENPVEMANIPGVSSIWRDIKVWEDHAYVTNDDGGGLLVIDLSNLPNNFSDADWYYWTPQIEGNVLSHCHNIFIDEFGYAYLVGCNPNEGGPLFVDVFTDPHNPQYIGPGQAIYSHDCYVLNNILYSADINEGYFSVTDVSDKANPVLLNTQNTPFNFTHNLWLSDDGNTIFTTDERADAPIAAYDISDLDNIEILDEFRPLSTVNGGVVPHNVFVWNDWLVISYYTDGAIIVDASRPDNLIEVGNFDSFLGGNEGFSGAWGVYPFFDSETVVLSDIESGLFVLEPNYVRACYLEGTVTDANSGALLNNVSISIASSDLNEGTTDLTGIYKTGQITAGTFDVTFSKVGYFPLTTSATLENGIVTILDVALESEPTYTLSGQVTNMAGEPIENAQILVSKTDIEYNTTTDAVGNYEVEVIAGEYDVFAGNWGYKTQVNPLSITDSNASASYILENGYKDDFALDLGWEATADASVISGEWERGEPIGIFEPTYSINVISDTDLPDDLGDKCYIAENVPDIFQSAIIGGSVYLTSPTMDLSNYILPSINCWVWFVSDGVTGFSVSVSNGIEEVEVATVDSPNLFFTGTGIWEELNISIGDFISLTDNMTVTFTAMSSNGPFGVADALVDGFEIINNSLSTTTLEGVALFSAQPNPFSENLHIQYDLEEIAPDAVLQVNNILGQEISVTKLTAKTATIVLGENIPSGVHFVQIIMDGKVSEPIKVIKN